MGLPVMHGCDACHVAAPAPEAELQPEPCQKEPK